MTLGDTITPPQHCVLLSSHLPSLHSPVPVFPEKNSPGRGVPWLDSAPGAISSSQCILQPCCVCHPLGSPITFFAASAYLCIREKTDWRRQGRPYRQGARSSFCFKRYPVWAMTIMQVHNFRWIWGELALSGCWARYA